MATFSVLLLTAPPPAAPAETGGIFVKIDGREVLLRTVELFLNRDNVKQIQVCFLPAELDEAKRKLGAHLSFSGAKMLSAGPRWMDQMAAAVPKIAELCSHVIVHDAARPAVAYSDIDAIMEMAAKQPAVALAAPLRSALVETDEGGGALAIHNAARFMQLLTPWAFTKAKFADIAAAKQEPHGSQFALLKGSGLNVRVTGTANVGYTQAMLRLLPKPKTKAATSPFEEAQW